MVEYFTNVLKVMALSSSGIKFFLKFHVSFKQHNLIKLADISSLVTDSNLTLLDHLLKFVLLAIKYKFNCS